MLSLENTTTRGPRLHARKVAALLLGTAAFAGVNTSVAVADDQSLAPSQTAGLISAPALTAGEILSAVSRAGYTQGAVQGVRVGGDSALTTPAIDIPDNGDDTIRAGHLQIAVPDIAGDRAQRLDGDTVAFRDAGSATVVQPTAGGETQVLRVSNDPQSAREFAVTIPTAGDLRLNTTGGVDITRDGQIVGEIRPPRATLNGQSLPTRFVIDGSAVKQITEIAHDATGTVVLDHWFGDYLRCITGVGVPIGSAVVLIAWAGPQTLYLWATRGSINYRAGGPPIVSTIIRTYGRAVYNSCRRYINS